MPVLRVALQMVLGILLTLGLQILLRAWASPGRRARGWNTATWGCALYAFGPASMLGFCVVHGRDRGGGFIVPLLRGIAWTVLLVALLSLIDAGFVGRYGSANDKRVAVGAEEPERATPRARGHAPDR